MSDNNSSSRIEQLEMRIAYQDRTIEDLSNAVAQQWKEIDELKKQHERMVTRVQQMEDNSSRGEADPPPPHY